MTKMVFSLTKTSSGDKELFLWEVPREILLCFLARVGNYYLHGHEYHLFYIYLLADYLTHMNIIQPPVSTCIFSHIASL